MNQYILVQCVCVCFFLYVFVFCVFFSEINYFFFDFSFAFASNSLLVKNKITLRKHKYSRNQQIRMKVDLYSGDKSGGGEI